MIKKCLTILMILSLLLPFAACAETTTPAAKTTQPAVSTTTQAEKSSTPAPTEPATETGTPTIETPTIETPTTETPVTETPVTETPVESFKFEELLAAPSRVKEHTPLAEVPAYATLVGSETLPPIDDQGQIGACQSQSVTYMQLTNAVAQYMKANGTLGDWNPSADRDSCYSPKFTYQFCGGSTTNVYLFLKDQGALTYAEDPYVKSASGASLYQQGGKLLVDTAKWRVDAEAYLKAMGVRITNYEQTYVTNNPDYTAPGKKGVNMTTEAGKAMIAKVKEAVASGNVVVTGGYPNTWSPGEVILKKNSGNLGKAGDTVITFATNNPSGGHNVSIVGYDDDLEVTANGITTKGAFLIANSWGKSYGRKGYAWITYDALNSVSEYEDFKLPEGLGEGVERDWPLDQFCFIYWDSDLLFETPALYAQIEVSVQNRDAFGVELTRTDAAGQTATFSPSLFAFRTMHMTYEEFEHGEYLNPNGITNGPAADFGFTVNFDPLLEGLPEGCTYSDYLFGVNVHSFDDTAQLKIKSITLKNAAGETLYALSFGEDGEPVSKAQTRSYTFSFGEKRKGTFLDGTYVFVNSASGGYIAKSGVVGLKDGKEKEAEKLTVTKTAEGLYVLSRSDGFVVEFKDGIKEGTSIAFNKQSINRTDIQQMHIAYNEDGTVCFFAVDENGDHLALISEDGKLTLKKVDGISSEICFLPQPPKATYGGTFAAAADGSLFVTGTTSAKASAAKIVVSTLTGEQILEAGVTVSSRAYAAQFDLPAAGQYIVTVLSEDGSAIGNTLVFEIAE